MSMRLGQGRAAKAEVNVTEKAPERTFSVQECPTGGGLLIQGDGEIIARMEGGTRADADLLAASPRLLASLKRLSDYHQRMTARLDEEAVSADFGDLEALEREVIRATSILDEIGARGALAVSNDAEIEDGGDADVAQAAPTGLRSLAIPAAAWMDSDSEAARCQGWALTSRLWEVPRITRAEGLEVPVFENDDQVADFVFLRARAQDPLAMKMEAFLKEQCPAEHQRVFEERPAQNRRVLQEEVERLAYGHSGDYIVVVELSSTDGVADMLRESSEDGTLAGEWEIDGNTLRLTRFPHEDGEILERRLVQERQALGFTPPVEHAIRVQIAKEIALSHGERAKELCEAIRDRADVQGVPAPKRVGASISPFDLVEESGLIQKHLDDIQKEEAMLAESRLLMERAKGSLHAAIRDRFSEAARSAMAFYGGELRGGPGELFRDVGAHWRFTYEGVRFEIAEVPRDFAEGNELQIAGEDENPMRLVPLRTGKPVNDLHFTEYLRMAVRNHATQS